MATATAAKVGDSVTFRYSGQDDVVYRAHSGDKALVLRRLAPDEVDDEVGPMFRIRFADGVEIDAFEDELTATT